MKKFKFLGILYFLVYNLSCFSQDEFSSDGYNELRIENEIKLSIPSGIADDVWAYLNSKYNNKSAFLKSFDSSFVVKTSEDQMTDQYFDNDNFQLLTTRSGVRHRSRLVLSDPNNKKNGRELMQIKINNINSNELDRGEYKYSIKHYNNKDQKFDNNIFLGLVKRDQRQDIISQLKEYHINAENLYPTILIKQDRKRIYIYQDNSPFSTLTLDYVSANYHFRSCEFIELELELNEINYTKSSPAVQAAMETINGNMLSDLLAKFPAIKQDQTPKYSKSAILLELVDDRGQILKEKSNLTIYLLGLGGVFIIVLIIYFRRRKNRKFD